MLLKSLLSKLKNIHLLSFLGTGSMSFLLFIFTAILFRSLTPKEVGVWFFFQTMLAFLDTFRQGFLTTAFVKFYTGAKEDKAQEIIGATWVIASIVTTILILINCITLIIINFIKDPSLVYFLKYFGVNMLVSLPMIISMCITQGDLRFDRLLYIRLLQVLLIILLLLVSNIFKITSLTHLMYINIFASLITSLYTIMMGWSGVKYFFKYTKKTILELFNFGKYTVGTSISSNLFSVTDSAIINFMLGPSSIGILNLGRRFIEVVEIPIRSFVATALPILSKYYNNDDKNNLIYTMKKYIGLITLCLIPIMILTYTISGFLIGLVGGGQYIGTQVGFTAIHILQISLLFSVFSPADRFLAVTLDVIHKPQVNFYKILIMLIINLISDVFGIYIFENIYGVVILSILNTFTAIYISYKYINNNYYNFNLLNSYKVGFQYLIILLKKIKNNQTTT